MEENKTWHNQPNNPEQESKLAAEDTKLLFLKTYRIENESSDGIAAAVESLNTGLSILYSECVTDLMKL